MIRIIVSLLLSWLSLIGYGKQVEDDILHIDVDNGHYYLNFSKNILGRYFLVVNRYSGKIITGQLPDEQVEQTGNKVLLSFQKNSNEDKINLYVYPEKFFQENAGKPFNDLYKRSNTLPILQSFDILKTTCTEKKEAVNYRIDVTDWLKNGEGFINKKSDSIIDFYGDSSQIVCVANRAFVPKNSEQEVSSVFFLLSEVPMKARLADGRVGYFKVGNMALDERGYVPHTFICKWNLQPRDKDRKAYFSGKLVSPKDPIIFYIDPAIPQRWVSLVKRSVGNWQKALEMAGFRNAIMAKEAPTDDPHWSLASCKAAIVFKPSAIQNMIGPNINDPRSGEIIQAHVSWYYNIDSWIWKNYFVQSAPNDPRARTTDLDSSLLENLLETILTHEVGHTLGLLHNMGASSTVPVQNLRNRKWLSRHEHTPSIMDYSRYNYVAQPEDNVDVKGLTRHIGPYDKWAIEAGYRLFPDFASEEEETKFMQRWISGKIKDSTLMFFDGETGENKSSNPSAQTEDVGDDPVQASLYGIQNLKRVITHLEDWIPGGEENKQYRKELLDHVIAVTNNMPSGQFSLYMFHVLKLVGGVVSHATKDPNYSTRSFVPKQKQKEAITFLGEQLFFDPNWLLNAPLSLKVGKLMSKDIQVLQTTVLRVLLLKLSSLEKQEVSYDSAYTIYDLFEDLKKNIWAELYSSRKISVLRRQLQRVYIVEIENLLKKQGTNDIILANSVLTSHLIVLRKDIKRALASHSVRDNDDHLRSMYALLNGFE